MKRAGRLLNAFAAGVVAIGVLSPIVTAITTIGILLEPPPLLPRFVGDTIVYGFTAGFILVLVLGLIGLPFGYPTRANAGSYDDLQARLQPLRQRVERLLHQPRPDASARAAAAVTEAENHLNELEAMLKRVGLQWLLGQGYIAVWTRLHRAEEALISTCMQDELHDEIQHDRMRLRGSDMPQRSELMRMLAEADRSLRSWWFRDFRLRQAQAKAREVRNAINTFRDGGFNGLLRLRNQTMILLLLTGENIYALMALGIVGGAKPVTIVTACGFYLVGAVVGLFSRLYQQASAQADVEDYGLATFRLLTIPVYSGLAGLAGVLVYGFTGALSGTSGTPVTPPTLDKVLSVASNPFGILIAAAFGAAPDLLLGRLTQVADKYKNEISSTQPSGRSGA